MEAEMDSVINVGEVGKTDEELSKEEAEGRARQLAHTVWHTPQLRHLIVDQLDRKELLVALRLDKTSFPVVAAKLYREIKWDEYEHFSRRHISYYHQNLYLEAVREVDMGVIPLLADRDLFSRLIDIFPLARIIKNDECTLEIPPRSLDGLPSQAAATLVVDMCFYDGYMSASSAVTADFRMLPHCIVEYNVVISWGRPETWDISVWDELGPLGDGTTQPSNPDSDSKQRSQPGITSMADVLCRPIRSLKLTDKTPTGHLADFSDHLDRRSEKLFGPIADLLLHARHFGDVPIFLRRHPEIARYEWGGGLCPVGLVDALMLDWDGRREGPMLALRHLVLNFDLSWNDTRFQDSMTAESHLRELVTRRMTCPSFADLDTLTFKMRRPYPSLEPLGNVLKSFPQLSTIAKALVQIGGTRFNFIIEDDGLYGGLDWSTRLLQSSLTLEVLARQAKERKIPKYIRSISGDGA